MGRGPPSFRGQSMPDKTLAGRRAMSGMRLLAAVCIGIGPLVITASAAADPSVAITRYSPTVTGNVGSATAGVGVTTDLVRDGTVVDAAPAVQSDADGNWTASLPSHRPSDALDVL